MVKTYEQILEEKGRLVFTNVGTSMLPLLRQNSDLMIIERRPYDEEGGLAVLNKFDVVLYRRGEQYIMHRIVAVHEGNPRTYDMLGDNQWQIETSVSEDRIIGVLVGVVRDGVTTDFTDFGSRIYRFCYCDLLPIRRVLLRLRAWCYRIKKSNRGE